MATRNHKRTAISGKPVKTMNRSKLRQTKAGGKVAMQDFNFVQLQNKASA